MTISKRKAMPVTMPDPMYAATPMIIMYSTMMSNETGNVTTSVTRNGQMPRVR